MAAIVFWEPQRDLALSLIEDDELYAPVLLDFELASIARAKIRRHPERDDEMLSGLVDGLSMDIWRREVDYVAVTKLALATGLSTYDASYLSLARHMGVPLVTFDRQLRAAADAP